MSKLEPEGIRVILATDCGSTTSKARFFKKVGGEYRYVVSGEAPTTVEAPYEDVTFGIKNAIREVEELTGHKLLKADETGIIMPFDGKNTGVDLYVTTSSAGGGLQMMCTGIMKNMTAESAERAALGAGAIVMDVLSIDDGRLPFQKIERLRSLRPDIILMAGGTDGGEATKVLETCELIKAAEPKARFGASYSLPIVYAGNSAIRDQIASILGKKYALKIVDNVRPTLERENPGPARDAIHEVFMEHVMSHAPGYDKLMKWTPVPILPTPAGEGMMFQTIAKIYSANVIGVGLGGATTNVYSVFDGKFVRTVSANLGMSYSIGNVVKSAGIQNVMRWIPFDIDEALLRQVLYNKMIRPTTIPQTLKDLMIEHAVAREALRLGFRHHKFLARPLLGAINEVSVSKMTSSYQTTAEFAETGETYIDMMRCDWIGGTGGLLSHAPSRAQSALLLIDGFEPMGVTRLGQDSVFMMPHLGVLSTVHPKAAMDIFERDCLVRLGTVIAAKGQSQYGKEVMKVKLTLLSGDIVEKNMTYGSMARLPLPEGQKAEVEVDPTISFDVGRGGGRSLRTWVEGGVVGIIIDARGRPLQLPKDQEERKKLLLSWFKALDAYPNLAEVC
jgi:uncharacterized protein (TIGR01319 family)